MGSTWSRWLESGAVFDKKRFIDTDGECAFYTSLKLAVAAIERALADEKDDTLVANATNETDDQAIIQLQYVLENWAREVGTLYDRVGDFPLILPMPRELHTRSHTLTNNEEITTNAGELTPLATAEEDKLSAACADIRATSEQLFQTIHRLAESLPENELLRVLAKYPPAVRLYVSQHVQAQMDAEAPFQLLQHSRRFTRAAACHVGKLAYGEESFVKKMGRLQEMAALLQRAERDASGSTEDRSTASFNRVMTEEMIELIDTQNRLENRLGVVHLVGGSLVETIDKLLMLFPTFPTAMSISVALAEDFHVPPKQFWWCLIRILAQTNHWHTMFLLSAAVPPPFGLNAIAETLVDAQRVDLAPDFIATITSPSDRDIVIKYFETESSTSPQDSPDDMLHDHEEE